MGKRAQTTIEYAVLIGVIVAGLIAMQVYLRRGMQGRLKASADEMSSGALYSPGATNSNSRIDTAVSEESHSYVLDHPNDGDVRVSFTESELKSSRTTNRIEEVR